MKSWLVIAAVVVFAGCFKEESDEAQSQAISTTVQGLIAFDQIQSNLMDDPAAAAEALLDFIKMPVAAYSLVAPPFDIGAVMTDDTAARTIAPAPVPQCLVQSGEPACDTYTTAGSCEAGGFEFEGVMTRRCADCEDPRGLCGYGWSFPKLKYTASAFSLELETKGHWEGRVGQVMPGLDATFHLEAADTNLIGVVQVCACTTLNVVDSPTTSGKPRKLVNSSFLVAAVLPEPHKKACALVEFDSNGNPSVDNYCACADGALNGACKVLYIGVAAICGDSYCAVNENDITCPEDCNGTNPRCGDGICAPPETAAYCPPDCPRETSQCGDGRCEIGETATSCVLDCFAD